ncbi:hypothetical protein ONE63_009839 [Megalurothrips usitatus]|uniref:Failed axon connections n=1 Tax=Megalurothrips usitatus TaxID=439358 RepID=A0AAV7XJP8_9NEOP|nr:hypothetical protein ONE63_009839 [Megalurothrips usitatus]
MASEENNVAAESKAAEPAKPAEAPQDNKAEVEAAPAAPAPAPAAEEAKEEPKKEEAAPPAPPKPTVHKPNFEEDVVYLYQFSRTPVLPSLSSFCLKVETWLRLAGIKYENVDHKLKFRSKKGQLPFIELNGEEIADSSIIIKELATRFEKDLDKDLDNDQKNVAYALTSMIENHLLWVVMWWRTKFTDDVIRGYHVSLQHQLGSKLPNGLLNFFFKFTYGRKGAKKVKAQGMGVHKQEEIDEFGRRDLKVLSEKLGDKPFFFGDDPTSLDVVAFANLAQVYFIDKEVSYPLRDFMQESCANLVGLVNRMKERCFPDWEDMCKNLDMNSHLPKPPPEEKEKEKEGKEEKEKEADKENEKEKEGEKDKEIEKLEKEDKEAEKTIEENKSKEEAAK